MSGKGHYFSILMPQTTHLFQGRDADASLAHTATSSRHSLPGADGYNATSPSDTSCRSADDSLTGDLRFLEYY